MSMPETRRWAREMIDADSDASVISDATEDFREILGRVPTVDDWILLVHGMRDVVNFPDGVLPPRWREHPPALQPR